MTESAVAALEHLLDVVHTPELVEVDGATVMVCTECGATDDDAAGEVVYRPWPCPTVKAATDALEPSVSVELSRSNRAARAVGKGCGTVLVAVMGLVAVAAVVLVVKGVVVGARALWGLV